MEITILRIGPNPDNCNRTCKIHRCKGNLDARSNFGWSQLYNFVIIRGCRVRPHGRSIFFGPKRGYYQILPRYYNRAALK